MGKKSKKKSSGEGWSVVSEDVVENISNLFSVEKQKQKFHFAMEKRNGKTVTLIKGLVLSIEELKNLSKDLKNACGTGGTVKDGNIELQGEYREKAAEILKNKGWGK